MPLIMMDIWLLSASQRFSEKFQRLTGKTCFFLAKIFYLIQIIITVLFLLFVYLAYPPVVWAVLSIPALFFVRSRSRRVKETEKEERFFFKKGLGHGNAYCLLLLPRRLSTSLTFLFFILLDVGRFNYFNLSLDVGILCEAVALYFRSCTPLPPSKSKVRKWLETAKEKIKGALDPAPEPAPNPVRIALFRR